MAIPWSSTHHPAKVALDRLADQLRPIPLLDRGIIGVHVAVENHG
jgi:hypothetical protein